MIWKFQQIGADRFTQNEVRKHRTKLKHLNLSLYWKIFSCLYKKKKSNTSLWMNEWMKGWMNEHSTPFNPLLRGNIPIFDLKIIFSTFSLVRVFNWEKRSFTDRDCLTTTASRQKRSEWRPFCTSFLTQWRNMERTIPKSNVTSTPSINLWNFQSEFSRDELSSADGCCWVRIRRRGVTSDYRVFKNTETPRQISDGWRASKVWS